MKKIIFMVIDGLGDRPIAGLGDKTPLEAAKTPHLDWLANHGICGLLEPVYAGAIPTSEEGHLALFGYDPRVFRLRRGAFTAQGAGLKMRKGDVALRGNFGTVDEKLKMIDRRAGRISKTQPLIKALEGMVIDGVKFLVREAGGHRVGILLQGKKLSSQITDGDPHYAALAKRARKIKALDKSPEAVFTAKVLNKFIERSHQILKGHPLNERRERSGLLPANYLLVRGASSLQEIPSFRKRYKLKPACVAGKLLYQQIAKSLGLRLIRVRGANGLATTNLQGKFKAALKAITGQACDFVFLHIKAVDSFGEDGDCQGKKKFIEKIDKNLKPLLRLRDVLIVVTADHATCCVLKRHCREPVPLLVSSPGLDSDRVREFSERSCQKGKLGRFSQLGLMKRLLALTGKK